ncbi:MAG: ABC transporter ATP-binding protein [Spirochaetaceae bacterium]
MSDKSDLVIETSKLTKQYPNGTIAVDGLNLSIRRGEVYGLLGPNGSGKTTTILILTGLTEATSGSVRVLGLDPLRQPLRVKRLVAYMPDSVGFYPEMTAAENIDYTARLAQIPPAERDRRIDEAIELMGLGEVADHRVGTYSRGMRQRLALAEVLVKEPRIAILDEPTQGLDPESAHEFLGLVESLREKGITVLLSSHLLDQMQRICDRVGLFYRGRLVLEGTVHELTRQVMGNQFAVRLTAESSDRDAFTSKLAALPGVLEFELERHSLDTIYREHLAKEREHATA